MMHDRIEFLQNEIPFKNKDIVLYAKHVYESLEQYEDQHRKLIAMQAINGDKPIGEQEVLFYETIRRMKEQLITTLENTIDDLKNIGDKNYTKHFRDGVE